MSAKPIVDGIEQDYRDKLHVIRVDLHAPIGTRLGEQYGVQYTPTFVILDGGGEEIWRSVGAIERSALETILGTP